jgi:hypothetical protein
MAIGDGIGWDDTTPTDSTLAIQIDDYMRGFAKGVRFRMANEHEWPATQSATSEAGAHKFLTLQKQSAAPTIGGTQLGAVYMGTVGTTGDVLFYVNAATQSVALSKKMYYWYIDGAVETGTKMGAVLNLVSDGKIKVARVYAKVAASGGDGIQVDVLYNGASIWTATASQLILAPGSTSTGVTGFVTTNVTAGGTVWIDVDKVGTGTAGSNVTVMMEVW